MEGKYVADTYNNIFKTYMGDTLQPLNPYRFLFFMAFLYKESLHHKLAKEQLYRWLLNIENGKGDELPKGFHIPFYWQTNGYGVHMELPIHETSCSYYFENSKGLRGCGGQFEFWQDAFNPNEDKGRILFVPDIVCFHKGQIHVMVEVVHKNKFPVEKMFLIDKFAKETRADIECWAITASNILDTTNISCNLEFELMYKTRFPYE